LPGFSGRFCFAPYFRATPRLLFNGLIAPRDLPDATLKGNPFQPQLRWQPLQFPAKAARNPAGPGSAASTDGPFEGR
jgi:hypothetical protein